MTPAERVKLIGVLGMLGSDHDGERASAGLLATRLLKAAGLTWHDVVLPHAPEPQRPGFDDDWQGSRVPMSRERCESILRQHYDQLTDWERDFLAGTALRRNLSAKQLDTMNEVARRLIKRPSRAA